MCGARSHRITLAYIEIQISLACQLLEQMEHLARRMQNFERDQAHSYLQVLAESTKSVLG
jgi:hypothetical protein